MMSATRSFVGLCLGVAMVLSGGTGFAQEKTRRQPPQQVPPTGAEDSAQPTADDEEGRRTLDAVTSHSTEGLAFEERTDGTIGLDLQGRFMHVLTAAVSEDGKVEVSCQKDEKAVAAALAPWTPTRSRAAQRLNKEPQRASVVAVPAKTVAEEK
jgi:hypothetical protein